MAVESGLSKLAGDLEPLDNDLPFVGVAEEVRLLGALFLPVVLDSPLLDTSCITHNVQT